MTFDGAAKTRMPFGKHAGKTLDEIAATDEGLRYLDWLRGQDWFKTKHDLFDAVEAYLTDPAIDRALDELVEG